MSVKHTIRVNGQGGTKEFNLNPIKAIKRHCMECYGFEELAGITVCPSTLCALWPFRLGKDESRKRVVKVLTEEQKKAASERMKKMLEARKLKKGE